MLCPHCGTPNVDGSQFCKACGTPLTGGATYPQAPAQQPYAQQPYAQAPTQQQPYAQQPYTQQPYAQQPYTQVPPYVQEPPKKGGARVAIIAVATVAVLALVGLGIFFFASGSLSNIVPGLGGNDVAGTTWYYALEQEFGGYGIRGMVTLSFNADGTVDVMSGSTEDLSATGDAAWQSIPMDHTSGTWTQLEDGSVRIDIPSESVDGIVCTFESGLGSRTMHIKPDFATSSDSEYAQFAQMLSEIVMYPDLDTAVSHSHELPIDLSF